eukprot:scaffold249353_cov82-Cyclotella_meneghiniana.AAC.4
MAKPAPFAPGFNPPSATKKSNFKLQQSKLSFAPSTKSKKAAVVSDSKKEISSKLSYAAAISAAKAMKKPKPLSGVASLPSPSVKPSPPSPVKKDALLRGNAVSSSNKRSQLASPLRENDSTGGSNSPSSSPIQANKLSFASVVKGTKPSLNHTAASPESPSPNKANTHQAIESPPVKKSTAKYDHSTNNSVDSSTIPDIDTLDEELGNFRKKLGKPIPSSSESESSDSSGVIEAYIDYKKQKANAKKITAGSDAPWSSEDSTVPEVIDPVNNSPASTTSTPSDVLLTPKAIPSPAKSDCKLPDHSDADWESYLHELDDEAKHTKLTILEPKLSQRAPASSGHKICAADYKFDTSQALTAAFNRSMAQLQELMLESYCNDENGIHPKSGPFEVDIDDEDGAFIICNSSGDKLVAIPPSIVAEVDPPCDSKEGELLFPPCSIDTEEEEVVATDQSRTRYGLSSSSEESDK